MSDVRVQPHFAQLCADYIGTTHTKYYKSHRMQCLDPSSRVHAVLCVVEGVAKFADRNGLPDEFIAPFLTETLLAARAMLNYDMGPVDKGTIDAAILTLAARLGLNVS